MSQQPGQAADAPADQPSLHRVLVDGIRDMIVCGELESGERVPEAFLCRRFGVSRTPLREALKVLSVEGLVQLRRNRGAIVTPVDPDRLRDIFETKGALEHFIGLHAASRATDADLARIDALHADLVGAERRADPGRYTRLNENFHLELARLTKNPELVQIYEALQAKVLRARFMINVDPARVRESLGEHEAIMTALRARARLDLAERLVAHNERTSEAMLRLLGDAPG